MGSAPPQLVGAVPTQGEGDTLSLVLGGAVLEVLSKPAEVSPPAEVSAPLPEAGASSSAASASPKEKGEMELMSKNEIIIVFLIILQLMVD